MRTFRETVGEINRLKRRRGKYEDALTMAKLETAIEVLEWVVGNAEDNYKKSGWTSEDFADYEAFLEMANDGQMKAIARILRHDIARRNTSNSS